MTIVNDKVWLITPFLPIGRYELQNFHLWETYLKHQVYALGWEKLGDVSKEEKSLIESKYYSTYGGFVTDSYLPSDSLYNFYNKIKINDILIAIDTNENHKKSKLYGFGFVKSNPYYNEKEGEKIGNDDNLPNIMKVDWHELNLPLNEVIRFRTSNLSLRKLINMPLLPNNKELINIIELYVKKPLTEGRQIEVQNTTYERNQEARTICLDRFGYNCSVCDFSFEQKYGIIGRKFIHVHHINPISEFKHEYIIEPEKDLRPVCPNCHYMLHSVDPPLSIEHLKKIIESQKVKIKI